MNIEQAIKQNKFVSIHQKAVLNLIYTSNWLVNKQYEFFKPFGITGQQFNVLRILKGQYPNPISAKEIKSRMLDMNSDISRLLERLTRKNLVERKSCLEDRRANDVIITQKGIDLLKQINRNQSSIDRIFALSEDEALQLSNLLNKSRNS